MIITRLFSMLKRPLKAKKTMAAVFLAFCLFIFFAVPVLAQQAPDLGLDDAKGIGLGQENLKDIIVNIVRIILGFVGVIMVILIMYAGFLWMTSAGDESKVQQAKDIIRNAIIGLIIILSAYSIVSFVVRYFGAGTGIDTQTPQYRRTQSGLWGLGGGPIESVYPEPFKTGVPINTWIAVTFKESIDPASICQDANQNGRCDNGEVLKKTDDSLHIKICEISGNGCINEGSYTADNFASTTVMNREGDNKTFVFLPNRYLGEENDQDKDFMVILTDKIERISGGSVFDGLIGGQYTWQFTTNGQLDLDPPEIVSVNTILNPSQMPSVAGVYPSYDSSSDNYNQGSPATATQFQFSVNSGLQSSQRSEYTQPVASSGSPSASLSGNYTGSFDTDVTVTISGDGQTAVTSWGEVFSSSVSGSVLDIGPYGLTMTVSAPVSPADSWNFSVSPSQEGDKIRVLENGGLYKEYTVGENINAGSADQLSSQIINDNPSLFDNCGLGCIKTIISGANSSRFDISYVGANSENSLNIIKTSGSDRSTDSTTIGRPDKPRNTVVQINFNEAVNPVYADSIKVRYDQNGAYSGATPTADISLSSVSDLQFEISNQYKTVEIQGNIECAVNSCGSQIYCWPINNIISENSVAYDNKATLYEVEIPAAELKVCRQNDESWCSRWGGQCQIGDKCSKNVDGKTVFYPSADAGSDISGILDMAGNSFNGSFNYFEQEDKIYGIADGQSGFGDGHSGRPAYSWFANNSQMTPSDPADGGYGDNFRWRFWLSDEIDKQSPLIKELSPVSGAQVSDLSRPVTITFDRLMRSKTLRPGWNYGQTAQDKTKRYLVLDTITKNGLPLGYWIDNYSIDNANNPDGYADFTVANIKHTNYDVATKYGQLVGSGLESITQNCFLPSAGPKNAGAEEQVQNCRYVNDLPIDCDPVFSATAGNPASYSDMMCNEIDGAFECSADQNCFATYYDENDPTTRVGGSWVISSDYSSSDTNGRTGCCFGLCK